MFYQMSAFKPCLSLLCISGAQYSGVPILAIVFLVPIKNFEIPKSPILILLFFIKIFLN
jgi:hypothetical protein